MTASWIDEAPVDEVEENYPYADDAEPEPTIRFLSPSELQASVPPEPPWVWNGYIARGAVTVLAGKPKAGKSTLGLALANAVADGRTSFLGHDIDPGPVVYTSEEGAATLAHKLGTGDLRLVTRETAWPKPTWPELIAAAVAEAQRVDAALIVIDTFAFWAALGSDAEKDAGSVQAAMEMLVEAARNEIAVLLVVHSRKAGGEDGEAIRGSSALAGAADIIIELERVADGPARQRKVLALSRYPTTPGALVLEHDVNQGEWRLIGEGADRDDARAISDRAALMDALSVEEGLTRAELEELLETPQRQWHRTLDQLIDTGHVEKSGAGKKGDPHRFKMLRTNAARTTAQNCAESAELSVSPFLPASPFRGREKQKLDMEFSEKDSAQTVISTSNPSGASLGIDAMQKSRDWPRSSRRQHEQR